MMLMLMKCNAIMKAKHLRCYSEHGHWPINVGELGVPKADVASKGRSVGESIKGARSNYFLLNKESA
jgi:hypothetical protein